jgi:hypothetical protein
MKKKFKIYPFLIGFCLLILCSCTKEINLAENRSQLAPNLTKYKDFVSYYEETLQNLKKQVVNKTNMDAQFTALDFTPDWSKAMTYQNKDGRDYLEVPVKLHGSNSLAASPDKSSTKFNSESDVLVPIRLIISKIDSNTFDANFMVFFSDLPYSDGIVPEFSLEKKINNFTGRELIFDLNGSFQKGWVHKNGKITNTIIPKNDLNKPLNTRKCYAWFLLDEDGYIIRQLTEWSCSNFDGGGPSDPGDKDDPDLWGAFGANSSKNCVCKNESKDIWLISKTFKLGNVFLNPPTVEAYLDLTKVNCKDGSYTQFLHYNALYFVGCSYEAINDNVSEWYKAPIWPEKKNCGYNITFHAVGTITFKATAGIIEEVDRVKSFSTYVSHNID